LFLFNCSQLFGGMLSSLVKEHEAKTQALRQSQETKKAEALSAATSLTQAMVDHLNIG